MQIINFKLNKKRTKKKEKLKMKCKSKRNEINATTQFKV